MSTNLAAVQPLSDSTQLGLRIPVILFALAGMVLALVFMRRLGVLSAVLAAAGIGFVLVDQVVNVVWAYTTSAQAKESGDNFEKIITTQNRFMIADAALITIGVALLVVALAVHRRVPASPGPAYAAPSYPPPSYAPQGYGPPPPGYPAPPPSGFPPPPADTA
jgi:hypothetical protein